MLGAFSAAGCDVRIGARLPELFAQAGIGAPTAPTSPGASSRSPKPVEMFTAVYRSLLPTAITHGITTAPRRRSRCEFAHDVRASADQPTCGRC